jgi:hypothetical protein
MKRAIGLVVGAGLFQFEIAPYYIYDIDRLFQRLYGCWIYHMDIIPEGRFDDHIPVYNPKPIPEITSNIPSR